VAEVLWTPTNVFLPDALSRSTSKYGINSVEAGTVSNAPMIAFARCIGNIANISSAANRQRRSISLIIRNPPKSAVAE
jgi:hypothetical protein